MKQTKYDLINKVFDRLTVIKLVDGFRDTRGCKTQKWLCLCSCGKEVFASTQSLINKGRISCGCKKIEANRQNLTKMKNKKIHIKELAINH